MDIPSPTGCELKRIEFDTLLDRNLEDEHQGLTQDRTMGDDSQNPVTEETDEFGKFGVKSLSYNQSQIHSEYDSAESIADSDLEDVRITYNVGFTAV